MTVAEHIEVVRDDIANTRKAQVTLADLADGAVRMKVESFAVTSNNVTYAVSGDRFGYWNFFPVPGEYGVVPMWGHAEVIESKHGEFVAGERVYGYLPMGTHLDVVPGAVSKSSFMDMAEHRQPMSPIYNQYMRLAHDPEHDADKEAERMIFGPLFKTGFLIESFMRRENWFGAQSVILTSASSKTAMGFASAAKHRSPDTKRIGLTSAGNVQFVNDTGLYHEVLAYNALNDLPQVPSVSVDFAGNGGVLSDIHSTLAHQLKYSCLVGATHIEARGGSTLTGERTLPGPKPVLFFAPDHAVAAIKEQGPAAFGRDIAASWHQFLADADGTVEVDRRTGIDAARSAFTEMVSGNVDPSQGIVIEP